MGVMVNRRAALATMYTYGRVLRTQEPGSQPQVLSQLLSGLTASLRFLSGGRPPALTASLRFLARGGERQREYMQCNMCMQQRFRVHVTTLSGVRGTGGVVPVLWYVYKEIDSLIQQRQFFSRGGRSAPCAPVATLEQTL